MRAMTITDPPIETEAQQFPNEMIHPAQKLEMARKSAGFQQVNGLDRVLGVSRNTISSYQTPGKISRWNIEIILKWCLACEVRPSWIDSRYVVYDEAFETKIADLREKGMTFATEHIGWDPRFDPPPNEEGEDPPDLDFIEVRETPSFMRIDGALSDDPETSGRLSRFAPSLASAEGHYDIALAECPRLPEAA